MVAGIAAYHQAIDLRPNFIEARNNLGNALRDIGQVDDAIEAYRQAIILNPDWPEAHYNLGMALLSRGDWEVGWQEYDWRWECPSFSSPRREFSQPLWDGSDLHGRTILLHSEQGFGDTIQFIRYLPLVAQKGGRIFVEAPIDLIRLLRQLPGVDRWLVSGEPLPNFALHCPLLSLPRLFATTQHTIPTGIPYLFPDSELLESWRKKLRTSVPGRKVGIAWSGNPDFGGDRTRSIVLDKLAPLALAPNTTFYVFQKGVAARQADQPPTGMQLVNLSEDLHDFAETAAAMCLMDLIITTDTSIAHLAGALGRPVWVMLQFMPDWRWLLDRQDSPWYPTMRLFRQSSPGDWAGVVSRVAQSLIAFGVK